MEIDDQLFFTLLGLIILTMFLMFDEPPRSSHTQKSKPAVRRPTEAEMAAHRKRVEIGRRLSGHDWYLVDRAADESFVRVSRVKLSGGSMRETPWLIFHQRDGLIASDRLPEPLPETVRRGKRTIENSWLRLPGTGNRQLRWDESKQRFSTADGQLQLIGVENRKEVAALITRLQEEALTVDPLEQSVDLSHSLEADDPLFERLTEKPWGYERITGPDNTPIEVDRFELKFKADRQLLRRRVERSTRENRVIGTEKWERVGEWAYTAGMLTVTGLGPAMRFRLGPKAISAIPEFDWPKVFDRKNGHLVYSVLMAPGVTEMIDHTRQIHREAKEEAERKKRRPARRTPIR